MKCKTKQAKNNRLRLIAAIMLAVIMLGMALTGCSDIPNLPVVDEAEATQQPQITPMLLLPEETEQEIPEAPDALEGAPEPAQEQIPVVASEPAQKIAQDPTPEEPPAVPLGYVSANELNLRSEPNRDCDIVQKYTKGQEVEVISEDGDWYQVRIDGQEGYMLKEYVVVAAAAAVARSSDRNGSDAAPEPVENKTTPAPTKTPKPENTPKPTKAPEPEKTPKPTKAPEPENTPEQEEAPTRSASGQVWIPTKGGKKYHSHSSCSGMIDPRKVSLEEAEQLGFTACGRCH